MQRLNHRKPLEKKTFLNFGKPILRKPQLFDLEVEFDANSTAVLHTKPNPKSEEPVVLKSDTLRHTLGQTVETCPIKRGLRRRPNLKQLTQQFTESVKEIISPSLKYSIEFEEEDESQLSYHDAAEQLLQTQRQEK